MSVFPLFNYESMQLVDGTCFQLTHICKNKCTSQKCKSYYESLEAKPSGSYCCPHGLASFVYNTQNHRIVFTGIRIKGIYNKQKTKDAFLHDYCFSPVIEESICAAVANEMAASLNRNSELESKFEPINDLLHETRSINAQIRASTDAVFEEATDDNEMDSEALLDVIKNVQVCSYMISNRFLYFDSVLNPSLSQGNSFPAVIFKKFDKMRKTLKGYMRKNVWISIISPEQSKYRYMVYPSFETLLFIVLENAIKYSPNNMPVNVRFNEKGHILDVEIDSVGPYCEQNEIARLCDKGFRGENAKLTQKQGQGFGLSLAKEICRMHNIQISFSSVYTYKDHGIKYGNFYIKMHFDNTSD